MEASRADATSSTGGDEVIRQLLRMLIGCWHMAATSKGARRHPFAGEEAERDAYPFDVALLP